MSMNPDQLPRNEQRRSYDDYDLSNEEEIKELLLTRDSSLYARFAEEVGVPFEVIERAAYYTQLREHVHSQVREAAALRRKEGRTEPTPLDEELGIYAEYIEPQVLEAVLMLRRKGYSTYESGFYTAEGMQLIGCETPDFEGYEMSPALLERLAKNGVVVEIEPRHITFTPTARYGVEDLQKIWNLIAEDLPDLQRTAPQATLRQFSGSASETE